MNLDDFMAQLRAHPEYFQVIAQDGGQPSIVMSDPRTDQQIAQYSVPDVTGYRYSDGFQAQMPTGEGDRISVANPDKRPTVQQLQEMWSRSQLPGSGVSFDQYMKETGAKVDASGRVDQTISKDWGFGGGSIWDAIVDLAPKALALYGGVTGLESLLGGAASASGGAASGATGAFDTFGSINSPTGLGAYGTVLDAAAAGLGSATSGAAPLLDWTSQAALETAIPHATQSQLAEIVAKEGLPQSVLDAAQSLLDPSLITSPVAPVSTGGVSLSEAIQQAAAQAGGAAGGGLAAGMGGVAPAIEAGIGATAGGGLGAAATGAALGGAAAAAGGGSETGAFDQSGSVNSPNGTGMPGTVQQVMTPTAAGSSLSQYLQGLGLPAGLADLLTPQNIGAIGSSLLGVLGSRDQANAARDTANQFINMGAPYRDKLASLYANPESYTTGPEMQGMMKAFNQSLSAQYGNPYLSPTATAQSVAYGLGALGKEKDRLAGYGGLGFNPSSMAGLSAQGSSNSGTYNALGAGLAQLTQPKDNTGSMLQDLLRAQTARLNTGMGL